MYNDIFSVKGKVGIVTGGTGVLGGEMCRELGKRGAKIIVLGRSEERAQAAVRDIESAGGEAFPVTADVLDEDAVHRAGETVIQHYGQIDFLINAAGGTHPDGATQPGKSTFFDLKRAGIQKVFDLNLMGTILPTLVFGKQIAEQQSGSIINISSMAAIQPATRVVAYSAAKAAVDNFTQWLAVHVAQEFSPDIRVNAIAPGFFLTEQNRFLLTEKETGELTQRGNQILQHTPMGRFGNPEDLIGAVLWLVSDASRFVTGTVVRVDGGFSVYSGV